MADEQKQEQNEELEQDLQSQEVDVEEQKQVERHQDSTRIWYAYR